MPASSRSVRRRFSVLPVIAPASLAKYGIVNEPVVALILSGLAAAALGFVTSFLVLRGSDLTRLMVTLGVALMLGELANRFSNITGGADGLQGINIAPIFGRFRFDMFGHTGYVYSLAVLFVCFVIARRIVYSPFGLSLRALKGNPLRAAAIGIPVNRRLIMIYTASRGIRRHCRRPPHANDRFLLARRAVARSLG